MSVPEEDFHTRLDVVGDNLVIYPIPDRDPLVIDLDRPRPKPIRSPGQALEAHLKMYNWLLSPHGEDHVARLYRAYTDPERNPRKSYNEEERMQEQQNAYQRRKDKKEAEAVAVSVRSRRSSNGRISKAPVATKARKTTAKR